MYCNNCGSTLPEGTKFCPNCGAVATETECVVQPTDGKKLNVCALVGFILSFISAIPGLIVSAIGKNQISRSPETQKGNGFATAGIIISIVSMVLSAIVFVVYFALLIGLIDSGVRELPGFFDSLLNM